MFRVNAKNFGAPSTRFNQGVPRLRDLARLSGVRGSLNVPNSRLIA